MMPDNEQAEVWFRRSAEVGNIFSQYTLGKAVAKPETNGGSRILVQASDQYAQFFLDCWDDLKPPSVMLSVSHLLHHMGEIFRDNSIPARRPSGTADRSETAAQD